MSWFLSGAGELFKPWSNRGAPPARSWLSEQKRQETATVTL
jgi:hypothetical protein